LKKRLTTLQKEKIDSEQKYKYSLGVYNNNLDYYYVEMVKKKKAKIYLVFREKFMTPFKNTRRKE